MTKVLPENEHNEFIERSLESAWEDEVDADADPWMMTPTAIADFIEYVETELQITDPRQIREQDCEDAFRKLLNDPVALQEILAD